MREDREVTLDALRQFGKDFKLTTEMPLDLWYLLNKDKTLPNLAAKQEKRVEDDRLSAEQEWFRSLRAERLPTQKKKSSLAESLRSVLGVETLPRSYQELLQVEERLGTTAEDVNSAHQDSAKPSFGKAPQPGSQHAGPQTQASSTYLTSQSGWTRGSYAETNMTSLQSDRKAPRAMNTPFHSHIVVPQGAAETLNKSLVQSQFPAEGQDPDLERVETGSSTTQSSYAYPGEQRIDAITKFSNAMIDNLPHRIAVQPRNKSVQQKILVELEALLMKFTETAKTNRTLTLDDKRGLRIIRTFKKDIAHRFYNKIREDEGGDDVSRRVDPLGQELRPVDFTVKVKGWDVDNPVVQHSENHQVSPALDLTSSYQYEGDVQSDDMITVKPDLRPSSDTSFESTKSNFLEEPRNPNPYGPKVDAGGVVEHLAETDEFGDLIRQSARLIEQYHAQKLLSIRKQVSLALRRHSQSRSYMPDHSSQAIFNVDWDLTSLLKSKYTAGVHQNLRQVPSTTGGETEAIFTSVGEYMDTVWPLARPRRNSKKHHLLAALSGRLKGLRRAEQPNQNSRIDVDASLRIFTVTGPEVYIVQVAQQLAWLASVCQERQDRLVTAHVGFFEANPSEPGYAPIFDISVRLEPIPAGDTGSCRHNLVGNGICVAGFPIPERKNGGIGSEVDAGTMAALSGIPQALVIDGVPIFKGRSHALLPIEMRGSSVQWHFVDTYPKKLEWSDLDTICPTRISQDQISDDFWKLEVICWMVPTYF